MTRHPALVPLSRDHHHALVIARRLRTAEEHDAADAARAFLEHWGDEEKLHFRLEEEVLLPAYAAHGDVEHAAVVRTPTVTLAPATHPPAIRAGNASAGDARAGNASAGDTRAGKPSAGATLRAGNPTRE
jgi:hypothetical protein